jgi:3-hydroxybutyryl-CoA dehydrogenase
MSETRPGGIEKVAVIGAGTMGPGIGLVFAAHGHEVALCDRRPEALERAEKVVRVAAGVLAKRGALPVADVEGALARIRRTTSLAEAGADADLVIEAVYEDSAVKRAVFAELDAVCPERAIFASNTSYLDAFACTSRPERTVIAHWFAPPHILPLVEVVRGPQTAADVVEATAAVLRAAGKVPVVLQRYVPGFAVNRLQRAIGREVFFLLENGYISAEDLDLAVKASLAPRMMLLGVVQRYDFAGLDLTANNLANEAYEEAPVALAPEVLLHLVRAGHFGAKTGKGFYDYSGYQLEEVLQARDEGLLAIMEIAKPFLTPGLPLDGTESESPRDGGASS